MAWPKLTSAQIAASNADGGPNVIATVKAGKAPGGMAINAVTDKIYVANRDGKTLTVLDGKTNTTTTVKLPMDPGRMVVNDVTNKIYVRSWRGTVIDGATNATGVVRVGLNPQWITSNTRTNKIYVTYFFLSDATHEFPFDSRGTPAPMDNSVTVIDGALFKAATTQFPGLPVSVPIVIAVNPATNRIYITHFPSEDVTVMDGASMNVGGIVVIDAKATSSHR